MKGVQCYELFGEMALKNLAFIYIEIGMCRCTSVHISGFVGSQLLSLSMYFSLYKVFLFKVLR